MIKKDTKIICEKCKDLIAITIIDIRIGDRIQEAQFKGVQKEIRHGDRANCNCGAPYINFTNGKIHTEFGWLP
jgi:hypothetical protein